MKVVDLFCGCGGMSLGFQNVGFDVVAGYDNWKPAISIYKENFDHPIFDMDLCSDEVIEHIRAFSPDIIIGGPPCQDFSIAGNRNMGKRANLTLRYASIIKEIKPQWFVMENVYNIERMPVLPKAIDIIKSAGYGITSRVIDASYCGVPQKRNRFFMIGHLGSEDNFLQDALKKDFPEKPMTLYDYLGNRLHTEFYYMHPRSYNRRAVFTIHEPSSTIRGVNRPIPDGYKKHVADKADIESGKVRSLTTKERSYIQTFPESFILNGNKSNLEQAIGNAVPVKLAEYIAQHILEYSKKK